MPTWSPLDADVAVDFSSGPGFEISPQTNVSSPKPTNPLSQKAVDSKVRAKSRPASFFCVGRSLLPPDWGCGGLVEALGDRSPIYPGFEPEHPCWLERVAETQPLPPAQSRCFPESAQLLPIVVRSASLCDPREIELPKTSHGTMRRTLNELGHK